MRRTLGYNGFISKEPTIMSSLIKIVFILGLLVFLIGGYIRNIYMLCTDDFEAPYKAEIIRGIGIPLGIGAFVGWYTFEEEEKD